MERIDLFIKSAVAFLVGITSIFIDLFGLVFVVLMGLIFLDIITGMLAAVVAKEGLKSSIGIKGAMKKCYIIIIIGAVFMVESAILKTDNLTNAVIGVYCVMEFISLIENGGKMGVPIPLKLKKMIATLKNTVGESSEEGNDSNEQK